RKLRGHGFSVGEFLEHTPDYRLDRLEHVFLCDETHLQVELIKLTWRTIRARILVAEARRDLEIAVEARDHDQLLELLRRLRKRIEFSRMQTRRHEIVARAFR